MAEPPLPLRSSRIAAYRDLAMTLIVRELVVRYKRSVLGILWALIEPLANVAVYVVVFGVFLGAGTETRDYAVFALWGVLPWLFISSTLEQCTHTLLEHAPLLKKAAFPRELLIVAVVVSRLTTLLLGCAVALVFTLARGVPITAAHVGLLLTGIVALTAVAFGLGLALSALQVLLRDVGFLLRFALRLGFYACPIVYPLTRLPEALRPAYELNPLVSLLWCFQAASVPLEARPSTVAFAVATLGVFVAAFGGWRFFRSILPSVADRL